MLSTQYVNADFAILLGRTLRLPAFPIFFDRERCCELWPNLFSQVMDFIPWTSFDRLVAKYGGGDAHISLHRAVSCDGVRTDDVSREPARHRSLSERTTG